MQSFENGDVGFSQRDPYGEWKASMSVFVEYEDTVLHVTAVADVDSELAGEAQPILNEVLGQAKSLEEEDSHCSTAVATAVSGRAGPWGTACRGPPPSPRATSVGYSSCPTCAVPVGGTRPASASALRRRTSAAAMTGKASGSSPETSASSTPNKTIHSRLAGSAVGSSSE